MPISRFTLRQLQVFLSVARHENVSRAGEDLALSQSAVSGALSDLEKQFDVTLFDRIGKRVQLNELGRALRPRAESLLEQAREVEQALERRAGGGRLRLGATLTIGNYVAVPLVARFMSEHPETRVTLDVANTAEIARKVENFEIDAGMIEGELSHPDLEVTEWRDDRLVVFVAPGHPLARARSLDDEDLRNLPWIVREPGSGTRQAFDRALHGLLPELRVVLELQHTEGIKQAVALGLGAGCLSRIALTDEFRRGDFVPLSVPHRDFDRRFFFVLHRKKYRGTSIERWLELCRGQSTGRERREARRPRRSRDVTRS